MSFQFRLSGGQQRRTLGLILAIIAVVVSLLVTLATPATCWGQADISALEEAAMKAAVARVAESVVRIETVGGLETVDKVLVGTGPTTGLIVDPNGYIVSSAFNFIQRPTSILVTLPNGQKTAATIVAKDESRKVVLLEVKTEKPLKVPEAVPLDEMQVGQWTVAVGRTFGDDYPNISVGVLSATNRIWGRAVQTDCKVSPANYGGPLVDIQGRVLGVLLPLSPQATSETAGSEWYDSGIGFAVPLVDILKVIDQLKEGKDLHSGLLGVTIKGKNTLADPAIIASVPAGTPAAQAGLKPSDQFTSVDGQPIHRHAELKQALGRRYADETITVSVLRDNKTITAKATLAASIEPYDLPLLGVLPMRSLAPTVDAADDENRFVVRYVIPGSPAAEAGIQPQDVLTELDATELATPEDWREAIAAREPNDTVTITFQRDGKSSSVDLALGRQPESIPSALPAAYEIDTDASEEVEDADADTDDKDTEAEEDDDASDLVKIAIAEHKNKCVALVPSDYDPQVPHGMVIWLAAPGSTDDDELVQRWKDVAAEHDLIILAPRAADAKRWNPTEIEFIKKTIDQVVQDYNVDSNRIVVHGFQGGSSLGFLLAFRHRDTIRGVAAVDAVIPKRMVLRANDPVERLAFYFGRSEKSELAKRIDANIETLRKFKYPVTVSEQQEVEYLNTDEIGELARWIDSLDRI